VECRDRIAVVCAVVAAPAPGEVPVHPLDHDTGELVLRTEAERAGREAAEQPGRRADRECAEAAERLQPGERRTDDDHALEALPQSGLGRDGDERRRATRGMADHETRAMREGSTDRGGCVAAGPVVEAPAMVPA